MKKRLCAGHVLFGTFSSADAGTGDGPGPWARERAADVMRTTCF